MLQYSDPVIYGAIVPDATGYPRRKGEVTVIVNGVKSTEDGGDDGASDSYAYEYSLEPYCSSAWTHIWPPENCRVRLECGGK